MPQPSDIFDLLRRLREDVDALKRRSPLANTGLRASAPGELTMEGDFVVEGNFIAEGKIDNDALVSPLRTDSAGARGYGVAITATGTAPLAEQTWTLPAGFTQVNVMMAVRVLAVNTSGVTDYLNARPRIVLSDGTEYLGAAVQIEVEPGKPGLNVAFSSTEARELAPGETVTLQVQAWTNGASGWAAHGANLAEMTAQLLWTR